jgi:hypothetical protein
MGTPLALVKILEGRADDVNHFLSAFPTQLLLRIRMVKHATNGQMEYVGYALPGATLAEAKWLIKKQVFDANGFVTDFIFADGTSKFDKIMASYSTYTYTET